MNRLIGFLVLILMISVLFGCNKTTTTNHSELTTTSKSLTTTTKATTTTLDIKDRVEALLSKMTLEQKVGQMMMPERNSISLEEIKKYNIGTIISGAGQSPVNMTYVVWADNYNKIQRSALNSETGIPVLYGIDAVHGHNAVKGATIFPHNIGLGAANDPELMYKVGKVTAEEMAKTGVNWNFSPSVSVVQNIQWGRTYESFGENPELIENLVYQYVLGLQEYNRVATAKHFLGDGATSLRNQSKGSWSIDQGNVNISYEDLVRIHLPGYIEAIKADVSSVMVSYSSFKGIKMHQNRALITGLLKDELGFKGIVVSDYDGIKQIPASSYYQQLVLAINAGIDVLMEPHTWKDAYNNVIKAVKNNDISMERINDAVSRILYVKFKHNIMDNPLVEESSGKLSTDEHKEIAREAVRKSLVLLKNDHEILPLNKNANILLLGPGRDNLHLQCGGWTVRWQGAEGKDVIDGTSIYEAFNEVLTNNGGKIYIDKNDSSKADVAVVVLSELPYAEGHGDNGFLDIVHGEMGKGSYTSHPENLQALLDAKASGLPTIVILLSGRPLIVKDYLDDWDAFVAAWLPGTEGGGITDVLFGDYDFTGKLPVTWPKDNTQLADSVINPNYNPSLYQFPYGYGLNYNR